MKRLPFLYVGGKGRLARWIIEQFPSAGCEIYCEPFAGGACVFWNIEQGRFKVEVLNDLNGNIVNFFRVLQDKKFFDELKHRLNWTLYSKAEFERAERLDSTNPVDRAWAFFVRQNQSFGGLGKGQWGRGLDYSRAVVSWKNRLPHLDFWRERLLGVCIDCCPADKCIGYWDSSKTLFYVDPPYLLTQKTSSKAYAYTMTEAEHRNLVKLLLTVKGKVVLSGYMNSVYVELERHGWRRLDRTNHCSLIMGKVREGKGGRVESLWLNY